MQFLKPHQNQLVLLLLWLLIILIINPIGDFPLNDDWCYGKSVKTLNDDGYLKLYNWGEMTLVGHVYWGFLFTKIFGFSFTVLRWSTLFLGFLTLIGVYELFKIAKIDSRISFAGTLLIMVNPVFLPLSFSYMTDIPFMCLCVWILYWFVRALKNNGLWSLIVASILICLAFTIRQLVWVMPIVWCITILLVYKLNTKNCLKALFPLASLLMFTLLFNYVASIYNVLPARYNSKFNLLIENILNLNLGLTRYAVVNVLQVLAYLGFLLMPIHFLAYKKFKRQYIWSFLWVVLVFFILLRYNKFLPSFHNVWINFGVGPTTLIDESVSFTKAPLPRLSLVFCQVLTVLGVFSSFSIIVNLKSEFKKIKFSNSLKTRPIKLLILVFCIVYIAPFLFVGLYDRYLLLLFPCIIVFLLSNENAVFSRVKRVFTFGFIITLFLFSVSATHDYMSWNRVRWKAIDYLTESGVPKNQIQGGAEYVTWNYFSEEQEKWWENIRPIYTLKFTHNDNDEVLHTYDYDRWLPGEGKIYVVYNEELNRP